MEVDQLLPLGITLLVITIVLAFGLQVLHEVKDGIGEDSCAARTDGFTTYNVSSGFCRNSTGGQKVVGTAQFNGTEDGQLGVAKITDKLPTIGLVIAAVVIIAILVRGFTRNL